MFTVADMMTPNPHTLTLSSTVGDANQLMKRADIRHIPLLDENNTLCAIITQRDLLAAQHSQLESLTDQQSSILQAPLSRLAKREFITVSRHASLKQAAIYMQKHKIGCLPVVDDGELFGIITDSDFVTIAINLLEIQEESEPLAYDE
ncbi:CBS domain-containing protein [Thaumasiovibrio subtropicus]|uniref:CBS domain-containing protein n=1 Tax=Thaumasiovibrio subtropicus TaxID=1891207 RepID=UPI000B35CA9A|nr:CBS domain-containing protein [Thaumasiovibrio subtropicus]